MNTPISEQEIRNLFAETGEPPSAEGFTGEVLAGAEKQKRRALIGRIVVGIALFLAGIPFEEYVLQVSQMLMTSLISMNDSLAAQLLAPVNTVGGLLTVVLLTIRVAQKRLFKR